MIAGSEGVGVAGSTTGCRRSKTDCMTSPKQILGHKFPSGLDYGLVMLAQPAGRIAANLGFKVDVWEEDGLGTTRGFFVQLNDACVVLVRETDHGRKHFGHPGPDVLVDGADALRLGYDKLLEGVLEALLLSKIDVVAEPPDKEKWLTELNRQLENAHRYRERSK